MGNRRKSKAYLFISLAIAAFGLAPLFNSLGNPRLAGLHGADILQLAAIGWCFGLAAAFTLVYFFGPRSE